MTGAALTAGCGIPDKGAEPIAAASVPFGLVEPSSGSSATTSAHTTRVNLYFVVGERLVGVPRDVQQSSSSSSVLSTLAEGVTTEEARLGLRSALGDGTIGAVRDGGGLVQVELTDEFDQTVGDPLLAIAQIVLTVTELDPTTRVSFSAAGVPSSVPLPDGTSTDGPVQRADFQVMVG